MTKRINVGISENLHGKLKAISNEYGLSVTSLVTFAVMNFLDQRDAFALTDMYKELQTNGIKNVKDSTH